MNQRSVPVKVERLVMMYGAVPAVRGIDFFVAPGSTVTLLGPSGCGKTTTLRCIAGLEVPTAGRITVGDRVVFDDASGAFIEPERRNIGMVFQSYAIWPHMTVGGNVGFPLAITGMAKAEVEVATSPAVTSRATIESLRFISAVPCLWLAGRDALRLTRQIDAAH